MGRRPAANAPRSARPATRSRISPPGRTVTTSPPTGGRTTSRWSPVTSRQRSFWPGTARAAPPRRWRRVAGGAAGPRRPAIARGAAGPASSPVGRGRHLVDPPVPQVLEQRVAGRDRRPGLDQRPVAGREREPRLEPVSTRRRTGTSASQSAAAACTGTGARAVAGVVASSRVASRPQVGLPRGERVPPPLEAVGQAERHVAQVDEQPGEPAGHLERGAADPRPEVDGVAEPQLDGRPLAGRQVDDARGRRAPAPVGAPRRGPRTVSWPADRPTRIPAGMTTVPSGTTSSSRRSSTIRRRSSGSAIVPSGARSRAWSRPMARTPGRRRTSAAASATAGPGRHVPGAARDDDEVGRGAGVERRSSRRAGARRRPGRPRGAAAPRRPPRRPTARARARAAGRGRGAGRAAG